MKRMKTSLKLKTAPSEDIAVMLPDIKLFCDVDPSDNKDDVLLMSLARAAQQVFEDQTFTKLFTQTWIQYMSDWPGTPEQDPAYWDEIELQMPPLQSVSSIKYYDPSNVEYTFSSAMYFADVDSIPGRVVLKESATWPSSNLRTSNGIAIEFVCGYGSKIATIPTDIQLAIKNLVSHWFHNRSEAGAIPETAKAVILERKIVYL